MPTASGDNDQYIRRYYESLATLNCRARHLSLFRPPTNDVPSYLLDHDIVYVGGGNTHNMLLLWRSWRIDQALRTALEAGIVLAGISAGSICWFEQGVTDSFTPASSTTLASMDCLGFLLRQQLPALRRRTESSSRVPSLDASGTDLGWLGGG